MLNTSRDRINTCVAKITYATRLEAQMARMALIKKHGNKKGERLVCYRCGFCGGHHLGRIRRKKHGNPDLCDWTGAWRDDWSLDGCDNGSGSETNASSAT